MNERRHHLPGPDGATLVLLGPPDPDAEIDLAKAADPADRDPGFWATLWPAARALADYLARSFLVPPAGRVLELGAGLAAPSLVCAARGCSALATDSRPDPIEWIRSSAAANDLTQTLAAAPLDFAASPAADTARRVADLFRDSFAGASTLDAGPELVIAADVLYHASAHTPFLDLCEALACPVVVALPLREGSATAEHALTQRGFSASPLAPNVRLLIRSSPHHGDD